MQDSDTSPGLRAGQISALYEGEPTKGDLYPVIRIGNLHRADSVLARHRQQMLGGLLRRLVDSNAVDELQLNREGQADLQLRRSRSDIQNQAEFLNDTVLVALNADLDVQVSFVEDVLQMWFPGVHVGGGYPEAESGQSKYALKWMLEEAKAAGLQTIPDKEREVLGVGGNPQYVVASPNAMIHESLTPGGSPSSYPSGTGTGKRGIGNTA